MKFHKIVIYRSSTGMEKYRYRGRMIFMLGGQYHLSLVLTTRDYKHEKPARYLRLQWKSWGRYIMLADNSANRDRDTV